MAFGDISKTGPTGSSHGALDNPDTAVPIGRAALKAIPVANPEPIEFQPDAASPAPSPTAFLTSGTVPDLPANKNREGLNLVKTTETSADQVQQAHAGDLLGEAMRGHLKLEDITKAKWQALSPEDQTKLKAILESQGQKVPTFTDDNDEDADPEKSHSLLRALPAVIGGWAAFDGFKFYWKHRHHLWRDWRLLRRLRKAQKKVRRTKEELRRKQAATDKAKRDLEEKRRTNPAAGDENAERTERELKIAQQEAEAAAKEAKRMEGLLQSARRDANFVRMRTLLSVGKKTVVTFAVFRFVEAVAAYATADPTHSQSQNVEEAWNVFTKNPLSKEATDAFKNKGILDGLGVVAKDLAVGAIDTAKYVLDGDAWSDMKKARDCVSYLYDLYKKDPEKARIFARLLLNDLGIVADKSPELARLAHDQLTSPDHVLDSKDPNVQAVMQNALGTAMGDKQLLDTGSALANGMPPPSPNPTTAADKRRPAPTPTRNNGALVTHPGSTAPTDG